MNPCIAKIFCEPPQFVALNLRKRKKRRVVNVNIRVSLDVGVVRVCFIQLQDTRFTIEKA